MKFTCSVTIEAPIERVTQLFADPQYLKEYQDGFIRKELISGEEGQLGTISKMYYQQGKGEMEITETITSNELPHRFVGNYHHKHMDNTMTCCFTAVTDSKTRYDSEIEYTAFRGFFPRMLGLLFPGMFKKQVQKWLDNFKAFVERS